MAERRQGSWLRGPDGRDAVNRPSPDAMGLALLYGSQRARRTAGIVGLVMREHMGAVLITGGAGYIGSHAVYAFLDAGTEVVVLDDLSTGVQANLPRSAPFYQGDVGDRDLVARIVREHRIAGGL